MAKWNRASVQHFEEQERTVRREISVRGGLGGGLLLRPRSGDPNASARYPACSARLLHRSMALSTLDVAMARSCVTDDAAVLTAVFGLASHIKPVHRAAAVRALGRI